MRKALFIICFLLLLPSLAAAELKVGVINIEGIVTQSEYGKKARAQMEAKVKSIEASMKAAQSELEKYQQELSKQSMALSQEAQKAKAQEYREKVMAFEKKRYDAQEELSKAENDIFQPVLQLLIEVSQKYAQQNGIDLLMNAKNSVIFATPTLDLTKPILEAFNKASAGK
jgi:outer membrane protein